MSTDADILRKIAITRAATTQLKLLETALAQATRAVAAGREELRMAQLAEDTVRLGDVRGSSS